MDNHMMLIARRNRAESLSLAFLEDASVALHNGDVESSRYCRRLSEKFREMVDELDAQIKITYFNKKEK